MIRPRCSLGGTACAVFVYFSACCSGQSTLPSFTYTSSTSGPTPAHIYPVDVNSDGITDIVADDGQSGGSFTVSISNGDGTFKAPVAYDINSTSTSPTPIATGDFNGDGKVDIAVSLPGTTRVAVYLGNGDGTFQAPTATSLNLPADTLITTAPIVAADFNHDGKQDLVVATQMTNGGPWGIYLLLGDGTGGFTAPTLIYTPTSGWEVQTLVLGDFDTDGNADVGVLEQMPCTNGQPGCSSNVLALFGNGATSFAAVDVTTVSGAMTLNSGDVNSDGITDLYGIEYGSNKLGTFLGNNSRKFSYFYTPLPNLTGLAITGPVVTADFMGDRPYLELAALALPTSGSTSQPEMVWFTTGEGFGDASYAPYQVETEATPSAGGTTYPWYAGPAVGMFNRDLKPDLVVAGSSESTGSMSDLVTGLNSTSWIYEADGFCALPSTGNGILLCSPSSEQTAAQGEAGGYPGLTTISASANSFGMLRKMEFWLDGVKEEETHYVSGPNAWIMYSMNTPAAGTTHNATIYAANVDNTLQRYDFTFTIGSTCGTLPQGAYGVNVCTPQPDGSYFDPVDVIATAKITGTLKRMELWVDGTKMFTETNSLTLNTTVTVSEGYHEYDIYAVNTAGQKWETTVFGTALQQQ
jgi:hypothetical protein